MLPGRYFLPCGEVCRRHCSGTSNDLGRQPCSERPTFGPNLCGDKLRAGLGAGPASTSHSPCRSWLVEHRGSELQASTIRLTGRTVDGSFDLPMPSSHHLVTDAAPAQHSGNTSLSTYAGQHWMPWLAHFPSSPAWNVSPSELLRDPW